MKEQKKIELIKFVREYSAQFHFPPTYQEIARHLNYTHKGNVAYLVKELITEGKIYKIKWGHRNIIIKGEYE